LRRRAALIAFAVVALCIAASDQLLKQWVIANFTLIGVVAILVALEVGSGWRSWLVTLCLALLLGGAIGNFIDRIRFGYVVDFADIGVGTWRFYIFNIADSAVTVAIVLVLGIWFVAPYLRIHKPAQRDGEGVVTKTDPGSPGGR
jgi:signal peptidase II